MKSIFTLVLIGFCFYASLSLSVDIRCLKSKSANGCEVSWSLLDDGKTACACYTTFNQDMMRGNGFPNLLERGVVHKGILFFYDGQHFWMFDPESNMGVRASRKQQGVVVKRHPSHIEREDNERTVEDKELAWFLKSQAVCYNALPEQQAGILRNPKRGENR